MVVEWTINVGFHSHFGTFKRSRHSRTVTRLYHFYKMAVHWLRGLSEETYVDRNNKFRLRAKSAGQDPPPTEKVDDMIQTSYALLFKRNGITRIFKFEPHSDFDQIFSSESCCVTSRVDDLRWENASTVAIGGHHSKGKICRQQKNS